MDGEGAEDNGELARRDGLILGASGRGWPSCLLPETPKDAWLPLLAPPPRYGLRKGPLGLVRVLGGGSGVSDASTRSVS